MRVLFYQLFEECNALLRACAFIRSRHGKKNPDFIALLFISIVILQSAQTLCIYYTPNCTKQRLCSSWWCLYVVLKGTSSRSLTIINYSILPRKKKKKESPIIVLQETNPCLLHLFLWSKYGLSWHWKQPPPIFFCSLCSGVLPAQ